MQKKENPLINLLANILIPVFILNKTSLFPGENKAFWALLAALIFPLTYGLWDFFKNSKTNYFSILGIANTLITGLLAVFQLDGFWFAIKEAAMPAILGIGVYISTIKNKPFFKTFISMSGFLKMDLIEAKAFEQNKTTQVHNSYIKANNFFAASFFLSSILNFVLALYIFSPAPLKASDEDKAIILNSQISQMTWLGMVAIGLPMMIFLAFTLFQLFKDLKKHTGLSQEELIKQ